MNAGNLLPSVEPAHGETSHGARVAGLLVYPIKSLDPVPVQSAEILPSGCLKHDRRFALFGPDGEIVTGKRHAAVHGLRTSFDLSAGLVTCADERAGTIEGATFHLGRDRTALERWFTAFFGFAVSLREDCDTGFPDDLLSPGPTVISTATLAAIADWFEVPLANMRARLRANIEIDGVPAFWEDRLFGPHDTTVSFAVGSARLLGVNPCARCIVPTRDPRSGDVEPDFVQRFVERRRASLPPWAPRERFDHFFRAAVNTRADMAGARTRIALGDPVLEPTTA